MVWECALFNTVDLILFGLQMELRASWKRNVGCLTDVSVITFYGESAFQVTANELVNGL